MGRQLQTGIRRGDLSVSVWVWKSEVIEFSNTGEVVSGGVEAGGTLSESGLFDIVSTAVSEDVHGVDDVFLDGHGVGGNLSFESGSGVLEESEFSVHEGIEGDDLVLSESIESSGGGFSEVGDSSVGSESLSGDLIHHTGVGGGVLVSHVSEHGVLSSELGLGPVVELAHESVVLFDGPWGGITGGGGGGIEIVGVVVVDLLEESLHLSSVFVHGGKEGCRLSSETSFEGGSSGGDDLSHSGVVTCNSGNKGLSAGNNVGMPGSSLASVEFTLGDLHGSESSLELSVGSGNIGIDGSLFLSKKSQERKSVVGVFLPFGINGLLVVESLPGSESSIIESLKFSSGLVHGGSKVSISIGNGLLHSSGKSDNEGFEISGLLSLESISSGLGSGVFDFSGRELGFNSNSHESKSLNDFSLISFLLGGDVSHNVSVFAIMATEFVSLGVTEFPDFLLDDPLDLFTESIDFGLPSESSLIDGSEDTLFSSEEISSLGVSKSVHAGISSEVGSEKLGLKVCSDGLNASLNISLNVTNVGNESCALFWDSFHGPGTGTLNEPSFIVNVLDVNWVLSVGEGCHVVLNCNTLLESSVSSTGTFSPGASVSDLGDVTGLSVSKAVGDLDPLPCFT